MKLAIITNDEHMVYQRQIITGIRQQLADDENTITVMNTGHAEAWLDAIEQTWESFDGIVVIANALSDDSLRRLCHAGMLLSLVSHQLADPPIAAVMPDNAGGLARLVDYLVVDCGCQHIAFVQGDLDQNDGIERRDAFLQAMMRHNLDIDERRLLRGDFISDIARESTGLLIAAGTPFDAIVAADYLMALAVMDELRAHEIRIPKDVCVVGFGDGPEAATAELTTVGVDVVEIGVRVARQIMGQINGLDIQGVTLLATPLVERATGRRLID